jgi:hypothetical protein
LGTYIKGTGSTYIYGGGSFFDGTAQRTIIHAGNIGSQSVNYATNSANADNAGHLRTAYIGGEQLNPQTYFGMGIGLKVAMTAVAGVWSDTVWINGYAGGDVLQMCALHTQRNGTPRIYISNQASNATSYGTLHEILSNYGGTGTYGTTGDFRAPIFYDSNDTGFYLDPNSYSRLNRVGVGGAANDVSGININGDAGLTGANFFYFGHNNGSLGSWQTRTFASSGRQIWNTNGFEVNRDGYGGGWAFSINSAGSTTFNSANDLPININGASNKYLTINPGNGYEAMVRYIGGSGSGWYVGKRTATQTVSPPDFHFFSEAAGATVFGVTTGGIAVATGDMRAPIFYDSENTTYNLNLNGSSYVRGMFEVAGGHYDAEIRLTARGNELGSGVTSAMSWWVSEPGVTWNEGGFGYNVTNDGGSPNGFGRLNTSFGQAYMRFSIGGDLLFYNTNSSGTRFSTMDMYASNYIYVHNYLSAGGSLRAPIFYDENNTGYYLDPTSTTSIRTVGSWRSDSGAWDGEFAGKIQYHDSSWYLQGGNRLIFRTPGAAEPFTVNQSGTALATGDFRAPIFYDLNNTSFYFDGNATGDSIRVAGDVVAYFSDERLKDIKENIPNALEKVLSLNGFYYEPNEIAQRLGYEKKLEIGLSAQEVERILPEIIKQAPADVRYKTLNYAKLTPLLVEAIKEQQSQIESQQQQINKLTELVNKLINK